MPLMPNTLYPGRVDGSRPADLLVGEVEGNLLFSDFLHFLQICFRRRRKRDDESICT